MKDIACSFLSPLGDNKEFFWKIFVFILLCVYIFCVSYFFKNSNKEKKYLDSLSTIFILFGTYLVLLISRFPELTLFQNYADESEWIVQVNEFLHNPLNWIKDFLPRQFGRIFSILPLAILKLFTDKIGFSEVRMFSIFLAALFLVFQFKYLIIKFDFKTALFSYFAFLVMFAVFDADIYVAYTSQYPAITAFIISLFLFEISKKSNYYKIYLFISGLLLLLNPFIKEQSFFLSIFFFIWFSYYFIKNKDYPKVKYLIAGSFFAAILIISPFVIFNLWNDLFTYLEFLKNYSSQPIGHPDADILKKFYLFLQLLFNKEIRVVSFFSLFTAILIGINFLRNKNYLNLCREDFLISILLFFVTCITVYYPQNFFLHYSIYFILPLAILFPYIIEFVLKKNTNSVYSKLLIFLVVVSIFSYKATIPFYSFSRIDLNCNVKYYNVFTEDLIRLKKSKNDRLLIWGWYNSYYEETGFLMGCRRLYPQEILMNYTSKNEVIKEYIYDINKFKPRFIIEAIGNNKFVFNDTSTQSLRKYPEIYNLVIKQYQVKSARNNEILYIRNN